MALRSVQSDDHFPAAAANADFPATKPLQQGSVSMGKLWRDAFADIRIFYEIHNQVTSF